METIEQNLSAISNRFGNETAETIRKISKECVYTPLEARNGSIVVKYHDKLLNSSFNPEKEAAKKTEKALSNNYRFIAIYGIGLGYEIEAVRNLDKDSHIFIVEPDIKAFASALLFKDFEKIILDTEITFLLSPTQDEVITAFGKYRTDKFAIITNSNLYRFHSNYYELLSSKIADYRNTVAANRHTAGKFSRIWLKNTFLDLQRFNASPDVSIFSDKFTKLPAFIAAAGPSLEQTLPYLKEVRERCLIISVDTAISALNRAGIVPDIFLIADPQYWNIRHLDHTEFNTSILVTSTEAVSTDITDQHENIVFTASSYPVSYFFEKNVKHDLKRLRSGGSVITAAWDLAIQAGCPEIYLAGIDFSYPEFQTHFRESRFEKLIFSASNRFNNFESANFATIHSNSTYTEKNYSGNEIVSDKRLSIYKWWFERQLTPEQARTYNLSKDGVFIENMPVKKISDLLKKPETRTETNKILKQIKSEIKSYKEKKNQSEMISITDIINSNITYLEKLDSDNFKNSNQLVNKIIRENKLLSIIIEIKNFNIDEKDKNNVLKELEQELITIKKYFFKYY